ncbi:MAG: alpha/beta hydrolase [Lachnospiraceae bacterium]|nr:alpha/beta hydrolase [Lachnospiraceae bacterium]
MRFQTHGNKTKKSLMLIHGMANTSDLFDPLLEYLHDYYVIVCELDGHSKHEQSVFISVADSSRKIEQYVHDELDGHLYGLLGFSLGGTIAADIISRGNIRVERTVLDAAFTIRMGILTYPFKWIFQASIWCIKTGIPIPRSLVEAIMGRGNSGIIDTMYRGVSIRSIGNACMSVYTYEIKDTLRDHVGPVEFWLGENEPYPVRSAKLLKKYLPQMRRRMFKGMGHGQLLHEHTPVYAKRLTDFLL